MKINPVEGSYTMQTQWNIGRQTDRQKDMTKLIVVFHSFAKVPEVKQGCLYLKCFNLRLKWKMKRAMVE
jgi:hypothetical protein